MPHAYLDALVTPSVAAAQEQYGSRAVVARWIAGGDDDPRLGPDEAAFVAERDTFFLATVGETGWPYVQHRGGPPGFLQVLDDGATLAWADLRGNRQYLSVGNLGADPRVSLLLLDQAHAARDSRSAAPRRCTTCAPPTPTGCWSGSPCRAGRGGSSGS